MEEACDRRCVPLARNAPRPLRIEAEIMPDRSQKIEMVGDAECAPYEIGDLTAGLRLSRSPSGAIRRRTTVIRSL